MRKHYALSILLTAGCLTQNAPITAQTAAKHKATPPMNTPTKKFYMGSALDAAIFSTATMQRPGYKNALGTVRFTYVINLGVTFNYDFSQRAGIYTGLDVKNIGFIEKRADTTIKRRTYNVGIPVGIKFGNMKSRNYFFLGGGIDMPINYRAKEFINRGDKQKFNEWFSDRTPAFMPYVFAGVSVKPGITFKLQYYLNNYLNTSFTEPAGLLGYSIAPYAGYNVHLILLSVGVNMPYGKDMHHMHHHKAEEKTEI